jgi:hypothetical protein
MNLQLARRALLLHSERESRLGSDNGVIIEDRTLATSWAGGTGFGGRDPA